MQWVISSGPVCFSHRWSLCVCSSVSTRHACRAHTLNMSLSTLAHTESDRLPSPHEADYTNLCKACKWFILQSTTKGFFTTLRTRQGERERERETLTPAVILTFTTYIFLCCCQQQRGNKTWWNLCLFYLFILIIKLRWCIQSLCCHSSYLKGNVSVWLTHTDSCVTHTAPFRTAALTAGLGSMFRKSF